MKEIDYEKGQELKLTHVCGVCGECLEVAWGGAFSIAGYILRCGLDVTHEGIVKPSRASVPIYIQNQIDRKEKRAMEQKIGKEATTTLAQYRGVTSLTKEEATHILQTCWPDAPDVEITKAALICSAYALNPLMHHLYLVEFRGREGSRWTPILGIGATRLIAARKCPYGYEDGPRRMTDAEQTTIRGEVDPDNIWAITVLRTADGLKAPGYGCWPNDKEPYGTEKGNTKLNMAMVRSERNAFDRLLPGEMPANIEVDDAQYSKETATVDNIEAIEAKAKVAEEEIVTPASVDKPLPKIAPKRKTVITDGQIEAIKKLTGWDDEEIYLKAVNEFGYEVKDIHDVGEYDAGQWILRLQKEKR